jgi:hypothetical protein
MRKEIFEVCFKVLSKDSAGGKQRKVSEFLASKQRSKAGCIPAMKQEGLSTGW